ncbi:unnamed protein product [Cuscuta campestris]|uniref:Uncharacterized protein n=1 Tax=Cuscuta campestris TaxID=132261 RepID=A0A484KS45_9ASTE|nr:unnamed protein product [Cuscuta campestris]
MYIICFRRGSIHSFFRLKSQLLRMRIEDILRHPLSPLTVCLPSIVEEFLRVAEATCLFSFPDSDAPVGGLLESEHSIAFGGYQRLDTFFPFDPCLLKKADRFIRPNYVHCQWFKMHMMRLKKTNARAMKMMMSKSVYLGTV